MVLDSEEDAIGSAFLLQVIRETGLNNTKSFQGGRLKEVGFAILLVFSKFAQTASFLKRTKTTNKIDPRPVHLGCDPNSFAYPLDPLGSARLFVVCVCVLLLAVWAEIHRNLEKNQMPAILACLCVWLSRLVLGFYPKLP